MTRGGRGATGAGAAPTGLRQRRPSELGASTVGAAVDWWRHALRPGSAGTAFFHRYLSFPPAAARPGGAGLRSQVMNFYTDDSPGLKIQPVGRGTARMAGNGLSCRAGAILTRGRDPEARCQQAAAAAARRRRVRPARTPLARLTHKRRGRPANPFRATGVGDRDEPGLHPVRDRAAHHWQGEWAEGCATLEQAAPCAVGPRHQGRGIPARARRMSLVEPTRHRCTCLSPMPMPLCNTHAVYDPLTRLRRAPLAMAAAARLSRSPAFSSSQQQQRKQQRSAASARTLRPSWRRRRRRWRGL